MTFEMIRPIREPAREMPRDPALRTVVELVEKLLDRAETPAQRAMLTRYIEGQLERAICDEVTRDVLAEADRDEPLLQCGHCRYTAREKRFRFSPRGRAYNRGHQACPSCGTLVIRGGRYLVEYDSPEGA